VSGIGAAVRQAFGALARVFGNRNLRRLELAWLGSTMGHWGYLVALSVYAYDQGGVTAVGVISVLRLLPAAVAAPFLATLADRYRRERVMMATDLSRAALMFGAAAMIAAEGPALAVYAIVIATNVIGITFRPAQAALLPSLARDPAELSAANVAASTIDAVSMFAGPAIGGVVLAFSSVETVFAVNALWFLWSAALLVGLRATSADDSGEERAGDESRAGFVSELTAGLGAVVSDRNIATVSVLYAAQALVAGAMNVFIVVVALRLVDAGQAGVGWLNAALGIGGFIGGFAALVLATRGRLAADFGVGVVLFGLPFLAIGVFVSYPAALIAFAVVGVGNSVADIAALTLFQRIVSDRVLGRVLGVLEGILVGALGIGALLAPLAVALFGARASLLGAGLFLPVLTLLAARRLAAIDRTVTAPSHLQLLRGVPMLGLLPEPALEFLAATATTVAAPAGTTVIREGDRGDRFYVIASGDVEIAGRRFGPGESFGEIALLRDVPRTATVTAVTDVELVAIERDAFLGAVTGHEPAHITAHAVAAARLGGFAPLLG
jgi:MFS family permease